MNHYKILFLSMSCNDEFFENERRVVHDTWASNLISNKFHKCGFFSYTSSKNGEDYIENNCIYVNAPDDKLSTYTKTIKALQCLRDNNITWDFIVRTNTSTFINVENTVKFINNNLNERSFCSFFNYALYHKKERELDIPLATGFYMILPAKLTNILMNNYNEFNENCGYFKYNLANEYPVTLQNTVIIQDKLYKQDDIAISIFTKMLQDRGVELDILCIPLELIKHYKTSLKNPELQYELTRDLKDCTVDPNTINENLFLQCTLFGVRKPEYRYIEIEHLYELNAAYQEKFVHTRSDIINAFIRKNSYKSYLEIGIADGRNYKSIECESKESCDPYVMNDVSGIIESESEVMKDNDLTDDIKSILTYHMTSDDMFATNDKKYDIIFIDGLHERHQVLRDVKNSLEHLNEGGVIIIHDCLPAREECQIVPRISGEWNGDTWKVLPLLKEQGIPYYVIDTDYGCGVIPYTSQSVEIREFDYDYNDFFKNRIVRDKRLNVITPYEI